MKEEAKRRRVDFWWWWWWCCWANECCWTGWKKNVISVNSLNVASFAHSPPRARAGWMRKNVPATMSEMTRATLEWLKESRGGRATRQKTIRELFYISRHCRCVFFLLLSTNSSTIAAVETIKEFFPLAANFSFSRMCRMSGICCGASTHSFRSSLLRARVARAPQRASDI